MTWRLPNRITESMIDAAHVRREQLLTLLEPATPDRIVAWLVRLGTVCAAATSGEGAADKAKILAMVLDDEPTGAFGKASFKRAVERFKFFPTAHELLNFVRSEGNRIKTELGRLDLIIQTGPRDVPADPVWSREAAERHTLLLRKRKEEENRELAQMIKEREASASAVGSMKPLRLAMPKLPAQKAE